MAYQKVLKILGISATAVILAGLSVYKFHPHSYKVVDSTDPTCILGGHTTYECWCGDEYTESIEPTGHEYLETDTEPTCTEDGIKTFTCKKCGNKYTESIDKLGHDYVNGVCARCKDKDPSYDKERVVAQQTGKDISESKPNDGGNGNGDNGDNGKPTGGGNGGENNKPTVQPQPSEQPTVQPTPAPEPQPAPQPSTS
ncbi:MAG: hypothetical protein K6A71_10330 [Lachnospiraceae bacterium]|nr:hypothetical protein [Lachnospiraceae bacterium]